MLHLIKRVLFCCKNDIFQLLLWQFTYCLNCVFCDLKENVPQGSSETSKNTVNGFTVVHAQDLMWPEGSNM